MIGALVRKARAAADVTRAAAAVARARRRVSRTPVGELVGRPTTAVAPPLTGGEPLPAADLHLARRWAAAVDRALRWLPGDAACLVRAGALHELLRSAGATGTAVRIGVRRGDGGFEAHAWVEQHGIPIAEPESLQGGFSSLEGVTLR